MPDTPRYRERADQERQRLSLMVRLPAGFLLGSGIISLLSNGGLAVLGLSQEVPNLNTRPDWNGFALAVAFLLSSIFSTLTIVGAVQMMRFRGYVVAIIGTAFGILSAGCCCWLGMPISVWALVILLLPDVRAAFH